jgi:hypothetical protein
VTVGESLSRVNEFLKNIFPVGAKVVGLENAARLRHPTKVRNNLLFHGFLVANCLFLALAEPAQPQGAHPGLSVGTNGALLKDGKPFRAIGVNYFDCFLRTLIDGGDTSYDAGFATLSACGIPFVRFCATGFWPRDMQVYLTNRAEYFRRLDGVVQSAQKHGIGMIPSLFWFDSMVPDIVGEPVDQWANPRSKTQSFMREYVREVVTRYRDNPAIWGGNSETNTR